MSVQRRAWQLCLALVLFCLVLSFPLSSPPAHATQILLQTPRQMGGNSELVVQARVRSTESRWNATHTKILTQIDLTVEEGFKGNAPSTLRVVQLGGVVDGVRMHVAGSLAWKPGEEVLLFLENARGGDYRVAGFSQGKFLVERDTRSGELYISRPALLETQLVGKTSGLTGKTAGSDMRMSLRRFLDESLPSIREEK